MVWLWSQESFGININRKNNRLGSRYHNKVTLLSFVEEIWRIKTTSLILLMSVPVMPAAENAVEVFPVMFGSNLMIWRKWQAQ
jgi:hypothetical protein